MNFKYDFIIKSSNYQITFAAIALNIFPFANCQLLIANSKLPTANCSLPTFDYGQTLNLLLPLPYAKHSSGFKTTRHSKRPELGLLKT